MNYPRGRSSEDERYGLTTRRVIRQCLDPDTLWSPLTLVQIIQDKFVQKVHFASHGVPLPEFREIKCKGCMENAGKEFGFPFMLKSKRCDVWTRGCECMLRLWLCIHGLWNDPTN